jgi:hypothetical protein
MQTSGAASRAGAAQRDLVLGCVEAEPVTELVNCPLQLRVVERDQHAAALTDHVVVMSLVVEVRPLVPCNPVTYIDAGDQVQAVQQLERPIDAGAPHRPITERLLHVRNAHSAVSLSHDLDQRIPRGALAVAGPADDLMCGVLPTILSAFHLFQFIGARAKRE